MYAEQYDWDWNRAEREFQASLAIAPNSEAEISLALLYLSLGRRSEADEHLRRARDLDSLSVGAANNTETAFVMEGRFEEAREVTRQMLTRSPAAVGLQVQLNALDALLGRAGPAILNLRKLAEREPSANMAVASAEAVAGHRAEASAS